jgi:phenylpyruvate tautomerase PptA (4-oxalocrotonate tautomerase family)
MPYINISLFPGQPKDVKVRIAQKITNVIREETPHVPEQNIWVTFSEIPADEWSIGGKMCAGSKD